MTSSDITPGAQFEVSQFDCKDCVARPVVRSGILLICPTVSMRSSGEYGTDIQATIRAIQEGVTDFGDDAQTALECLGRHCRERKEERLSYNETLTSVDET